MKAAEGPGEAALKSRIRQLRGAYGHQVILFDKGTPNRRIWSLHQVRRVESRSTNSINEPYMLAVCVREELLNLLFVP